LKQGLSGEELFFDLALDDITQAADLFRPTYERTCGVDGFVSLEVSPRLAHDTRTTLAQAEDLYARAGRSNLFIKIPGTVEGLPAIEEAIFAGVSVNVTLLFSREHYMAPRPICAVSSDASPKGLHQASPLSHHCSSVAGTSPPQAAYPMRRPTGSALPLGSGGTRHTAT